MCLHCGYNQGYTYRVSGHSVSHFDSILHPLKVGILQKCIKSKFAIQALKNFPPIFVWGFLIKIWRCINLKKRVKNGNFP